MRQPPFHKHSIRILLHTLTALVLTASLLLGGCQGMSQTSHSASLTTATTPTGTSSETATQATESSSGTQSLPTSTEHSQTTGGISSATTGTTATTAPTVTTAGLTPTPMPTSAPSPTPTPAPTVTPEPTATPTPHPTPQPTATPTPRPTPTPTPLPVNTQLSWWYITPDPLFQDLPAKISTVVKAVITPYRTWWQKPVTGSKIIFLTMDEGYEYQTNTTEILDIAKEKKVKITFFVTGSYIKNNKALVRRMVSEGHLVANHTVNHPNLVETMAEDGYSGVRKELTGVENAFADLTGKTMPRLVRPPSGYYSARVLDCLTDEGYAAVFWSFAYHDWDTADQPARTDAKVQILGQLHNGSIILLHAVSDTNVAILGDVIDGARAQGYEFALLPVP